MLGQTGLAALVMIVAAKMAATIACGGLGVPGGLALPRLKVDHGMIAGSPSQRAPASARACRR
jgi:ABC-type proline/glycine betaine transport system permease subunit